MLDIWHSLQQRAVDSAIDGERFLAPVYGPKEDVLSSDNVLIEWAVIEAVKQFQIRRVCFYNRLTIHKVIVKVLHSFIIKNGRAIAAYFNFYVSHVVVHRGF